jgi:hypothetical protein
VKAFTCIGYLAHDEKIASAFKRTQAAQFFDVILNKVENSKRACALSVWAIGVQRLLNQETFNAERDDTVIRMIEGIRFALNNPYKSTTTTQEALNVCRLFL